MHLYKPLIFMTLGVATTQARCYGVTPAIGGLTVQGADAVVDEFCGHDLAGYFTEGQTKYRCKQLQSYKAEFWVTWMGSGDLTLNSEDCKTRLRDEIHGCDVGGESVVADWYVR
jgi:hypothetical protein